MIDMGVMKYYDRKKGEYVTVTPETPLPTTGSGGTPQPGSITTEMIKDGAVTDDKLANKKVDMPNPLIPSVVLGTTLETNQMGLVPYSQDPTPDHLAMYQFGGQLSTADPQNANDAANKKYVDNQINTAVLKSALASIEPIADPSTAEVGDVATLLNSLITALKG